MTMKIDYKGFNEFFATIADRDYNSEKVAAMKKTYEKLYVILMDNDPDAVMQCTMLPEVNVASVKALTFELAVNDDDVADFLASFDGAANMCVYVTNDDRISVSFMFRDIMNDW